MIFRPILSLRRFALFSRISLTSILVGLVSVGLTGLNIRPVQAAPSPGINSQINFQGRLLNAAGAVIADGNYNMQFKIYKNGDGLAATDNTCTIADCASTTGTLQWTEEWLNQASHGVTVKNGYFSVSLGAITSLAGIDLNQPVLWLSMNVAGGANATSVSCTPFSSCTGDGEMLPMKRMASAVYAFNAGQLGGLTSAGFIQNQAASPQAASLYIQSVNNGDITGAVRAKSGQTADVFEVQASGGGALFKVSSNTNLSTFTDNLLVNGQDLSPAALTVKGAGNSGGNYIIEAQLNNGNSVARITDNGELAVGNTSGLAGTLLLSDGGSHYGLLKTATLGSTTTYTLPDPGSSSASICLSSGNCTAATTLQNSYNSSTSPEIVLNSTNGALTVRDSSGGLGANLLEVQNNAGTTTYFAVAPGTGTVGTFTGNVAVNGTGSSSNTALVVKGNASQSGTDLITDIQTSGGTTLARFTANGGLYLGNQSSSIAGSVNLAQGSNGYGTIDATSLTGNRTAHLPDATGTICLQTATSCGFINNQLASVQNANLYVASAGAAGDPTAQLQLASGQTGDLLQFRNASATLVTKFDAWGYVVGAGLLRVLAVGKGTLGLDTVGAGTVSIGNANAATINIGANAAVHTLHVADGAAVQTVTIGSTNSSSGLTLQAGSGNAAVTAASGTITLQTTTSGQINIIPGGTSNVVIGTSDTTGTLLVLDTKTDSGDPTGTNGGMYYNSTYHMFRCYRDSAWETCGVNPIDRGFLLEDDFIGGSSGGGTIGNAGWTAKTIGATPPTIGYNPTTPAVTVDRPGILDITTAAATGNGGTIATVPTSSNPGFVLGAGYILKTTAAVASATATTQTLRIGLHNEYGSTTAPTTGVYWEADPSTNTACAGSTPCWRYCYNNTSTPTCANSGTSIVANTFARLAIQINSLGSGTSSVTFTINGTSTTVPSVTINTTNTVNPAITCYSNTTTAQDCFVDYFQLRGVATGIR